MASRGNSLSRIDLFKLEGDLRDAYVELLSAQSTISRLRLRYSPEEVARNGGSFILLRSISAAESIREYFVSIRKALASSDGPSSHSPEDSTNRSPR
jgi:hypothetical protein